MSRFSIEIHFSATKEEIKDSLVSYLYSNFYLVDFIKEEEIEPLFVDYNFDNIYTISKLDEKITMVVCAYNGDHDTMAETIACELKCDAMYGHNNDQVDNWRWIRFEKGIKKDEYWYLGQEWVRIPEKHEPESLVIYEAFEKFSLGYNHASIYDAIWMDRDSLIIKTEEF